MSFAFQTIDILVFAVLLISGLLAFFRGFVHEILAIGKWIGAIIAVIYGFPFLRPLMGSFIPHSLIADIATSLLLFVGTLAVLAYFSYGISNRIHDSALGPVDRSLGFLFGLLRGAIFVCIAFLILAWTTGREPLPPSIADARTLPYIRQGAGALTSLVSLPDLLPGMEDSESADKPAEDKKDATPAKPAEQKSAPKSSTSKPAAKPTVKSPSTPARPGNSPTPPRGQGYGEESRDSLDELIEEQVQ